MYVYYILSPKNKISQIIIKISLLVSYIFSKLFYKFTGIEVCGDIGKMDKNKRYIIIANHVSRHDTHMIVSSLPVIDFVGLLPIRFFTAQKELDKKITGLIIKLCGGFPSHSKENCISGLRGSLELSDNNETLFMFPQGKIRSKKHKFITGISYLSKKREFNIIPVYVSIGEAKKHKKVVFGKSFILTNKQLQYSDEKIANMLQEKVYLLKNRNV